jgi:hypothetical protein
MHKINNLFRYNNLRLIPINTPRIDYPTKQTFNSKKSLINTIGLHANNPKDEPKVILLEFINFMH